MIKIKFSFALTTTKKITNVIWHFFKQRNAEIAVALLSGIILLWIAKPNENKVLIEQGYLKIKKFEEDYFVKKCDTVFKQIEEIKLMYPPSLDKNIFALASYYKGLCYYRRDKEESDFTISFKSFLDVLPYINKLPVTEKSNTYYYLAFFYWQFSNQDSLSRETSIQYAEKAVKYSNLKDDSLHAEKLMSLGFILSYQGFFQLKSKRIIKAIKFQQLADSLFNNYNNNSFNEQLLQNKSNIAYSKILLSKLTKSDTLAREALTIIDSVLNSISNKNNQYIFELSERRAFIKSIFDSLNLFSDNQLSKNKYSQTIYNDILGNKSINKGPSCAISIRGKSIASASYTDVIDMVGTGFTPNSTAKLYFSYPDGHIDSSIVKCTNISGYFSNSYTVTASTQLGTYLYYALDLSTGIKTKSVAYTINYENTFLTPTSLSISDYTGGFLISWNNVVGATSYKIFWGTTNAVDENSNIINDDSSPTGHIGLIRGTTYYYRIAAVNNAGMSSLSPTVSKIY